MGFLVHFLHLKDISTVQGVNEQIIAAQEQQTRDTCRHIVQDLTSPEGKLEGKVGRVVTGSGVERKPIYSTLLGSRIDNRRLVAATEVLFLWPLPLD